MSGIAKEVGFALLSVIGLVGSCLVVCLIAAIIVVRWPFQLGSWLLEKVLDILAALCVWLEAL